MIGRNSTFLQDVLSLTNQQLLNPKNRLIEAENKPLTTLS